MYKLLKILFILIILTIIEVSTSNNGVAFSIIKSFCILFIIGSFKTLTNHYEKTIPILLIILLIPSTVAVDNSIPNVMGSSITTMTGSEAPYFMIVNNNASDGYIDSAPLSEAGYFTPRTNHVYSGNNILDAKIDHTTPATAGYRIFGTDEQGNVFYSSTNFVVNYSLGFYTCCDAYGNPTNSNPLYRAAALSAIPAAPGSPKKLAINSVGDVFVANDDTIVKLIKSASYSSQLFYDTTFTNADLTYMILDIQIDSSDNVHYIIGGYDPSYGVAHASIFGHGVLNSAGTVISPFQTLATESFFATNRGFIHGGLVLDSVNPIQNYTYMITNNSGGTYKTYVKHNSTAGTVEVVSGALPTVTKGTSMMYHDNQLFISFPDENLIRSYATNYEGLFIEGVGQASQLTYLTKSIDSVETSYALNQPVELSYSLSIFPFSSSMTFDSFKNDYRYQIDMYDENGGKFISYNIPASQFVETGNFIDGYGADAAGSIIFKPTINWTTGNQTAKLWEVRTSVNTKSLLDTESILINSNITDTTNVSIEVPITSGTGVETLNQWDTYVSMLGMGVNSISKLFFALIIITTVAITGMKLAGGEVAMVGAFAPYIFFTYIEYIPKWIFIIVIIMLILKSKIFR